MDPSTSNGAPATRTLPLASDALGDAPEKARHEAPEWVKEARAGLTEPGRYLAYEEGEHHNVVPVTREWTRVGRSLAADIRFDDATVSRRHALIVVQADGVRVLDDRSLNGVYVNGERVEWSPLADGDQISVGRHSLWFFDNATIGAVPAPPAGAIAD
jgi:hypothetical protein